MTNKHISNLYTLTVYHREFQRHDIELCPEFDVILDESSSLVHGRSTPLRGYISQSVYTFCTLRLGRAN